MESPFEGLPPEEFNEAIDQYVQDNVARNDCFLKITGRVNIPVPLEVDTDYQFTGAVSVYGVDQSSKQDGTHNFVYKAQFSDSISLIKGDKIILGTKGQSWSQKWRNLVINDGTDYDAFERWLFQQHDRLKEEFARSL